MASHMAVLVQGLLLYNAANDRLLFAMIDGLWSRPGTERKYKMLCKTQVQNPGTKSWVLQ